MASEPPKLRDLWFFFMKFCLGILFFFLIKKRVNCSKQSAAPFIKLFRTHFKNNKCVSQNHQKKSKQNFVKTTNHEYFGGSDVMNVLIEFQHHISIWALKKYYRGSPDNTDFEELKIPCYVNISFRSCQKESTWSCYTKILY